MAAGHRPRLEVPNQSARGGTEGRAPSKKLFEIIHVQWCILESFNGECEWMVRPKHIRSPIPIGRINIYFSVQSLLKLRVTTDFYLFFLATRAMTNNNNYCILLVFPAEICFTGPCCYERLLHAAAGP